jgi:hypothetical protein
MPQKRKPSHIELDVADYLSRVGTFDLDSRSRRPTMEERQRTVAAIRRTVTLSAQRHQFSSPNVPDLDAHFSDASNAPLSEAEEFEMRQLEVMLDPSVAHPIETEVEPSPKAEGVPANREQLYRRCETVLDSWTLWMPQRLVDEQLGDCLEDIYRRIHEGQSRWLVWGKVAWTMFWLTVHSVGYFLKASGIRKAN